MSFKIGATLALLLLAFVVQDAHSQNPKTSEDFNNRGLERQAKGDLQGAIADYDRALQFKQDDPGIYYGRGSARQKKKDLEGAPADYSRAIELDPGHALAYANRGVIKGLQKKNAEAALDFEKAFKLDPSLKATYREFSERPRPQ